MEKSELESLLKEKKITLKEYEDELDILNGKRKRDDVKHNLDKKHNDVSTKKELTDRELQEQILETLNLNQKDNEIIKKWVVFWSWFTIIGLVIYFITLLAIFR